MATGGVPELSPICAYVAARTGCSLSAQQVGRLQAVLQTKLAGHSEEAFLVRLKTPSGAADLAALMASIAVHKTDLFRDDIQLQAFREHVLKPLARVKRGPLRLWSAGCATGEEVATLLILLAEVGAHRDSTVLGSDISAAALKDAQALAFQGDLMRRVPAELKAKHFRPLGVRFQLHDELRAQATFLQHNLMDSPYPLPPGGLGFDVIFCRNVLIYFTDTAFDLVVSRLSERLVSGGTMVLSSAEPILRRQPGLKTLQCQQAFFYGKRDGVGEAMRLDAPAPPSKLPPLALAPPLATPRPSPAVAPLPRVVPSPPSAPISSRPSAPEPPLEDPGEEAHRLFALVLEWAAEGEPDVQTEQGLRRCLYLDPHLAQARYLLGMLLEQRGSKADAASEYRRAFAALTEGRARPTSFFLNNERLKKACAAALTRTGFRRA